VRLRREGNTYADSGVQLGISRQHAHQLVSDELRQLRTETGEATDDMRRLELDRLDAMAMTLGLLTKVDRGDTAAIQTVLKIMDRHAKLLGLDAPEKFDVRLHSEAQRLADELGLDVDEVLREAESILAGEA
jgi:hypothetical protein